VPQTKAYQKSLLPFAGIIMVRAGTLAVALESYFLAVPPPWAYSPFDTCSRSLEIRLITGYNASDDPQITVLIW